MATNQFHKEMGERIAMRRKSLGMTQEQLAELMDVTPQTVSYIETGRNAIRPENLARLCEVLNVSADYILLNRSSYLEANRVTAKLSDFTAPELLLVDDIINNCRRLAGYPVL